MWLRHPYYKNKSHEFHGFLYFFIYPNLNGDLSDLTAYNAIARDPDYGPRFLSEFEDRLYFGTDMTAPDMEVELDKLLIHWRETGKISETTFRKIAYDNAAKLLEL